MFRLRASSLGKSQAEMEAFLVKKEGDGRAGAAAELGTKMHRVLQDRWRKLGIMEADEVEVFDPKLNVTGHIDAILRIPDRQGRTQRVIADIKTKTAAKYAEVVRTNKPEDENLDQLLFYMQATGIKRGLLTYINREDVRQVHQIEVKFDAKRFQTAVARMEAARNAVKERIRTGFVKPGDLYDPLTKYEILSDVAPYSKEFAELKQWAQRSTGLGFHLIGVVTFGLLRVRKGLPCGVENPVSAALRAYGGVFGPESRVYRHAFRVLGSVRRHACWFRLTDPQKPSQTPSQRPEQLPSSRLKPCMRGPIKPPGPHEARRW